MSLFKKQYFFPLLLLLVLLFLPLNALAANQTLNTQKTIILDKDQTINNDYFAAGSKVTIDGTINGDAYIAGGQIDINGTIKGDLLIAGGQITVRGDIGQSIRGAGGNITIEGNIGKNISLAGGNIVLDKGAKVIGNVVIVGGNSQILASNILGDITAGIGMLDIASGTVVQGNLNYWSNNKATISFEAKILKSTTFHQTNFNHPMINQRKMFSNVSSFFKIIGFISSLLFGILLIWLFPIYSQKISSDVRKKFWLNLLIGFISFIAVPILLVILFVTIIGAPFALLLLFAYGFTIYVSKLFIAFAVGQVIGEKTKWKMSPIWAFVFGLILYSFVGLIPVIGGLMKAIVMLVGIGVLIRQKRYYFTTLRNKKLI